MGEIADQLIDDAIGRMYDFNDHSSFHKKKTKIHVHPKGKWKTAQGEVLDIGNMSDYHIENCIRLLKNHNTNQSKLKELEDEIEFRWRGSVRWENT